MPIIIANEWSAKRESVDVTEDGSTNYSGDLTIFFWSDEKRKNYFANFTKLVEASRDTHGEIVIKEEPDERGNLVNKYYKRFYRHKVIVTHLKYSTSGVNGWITDLPCKNTLYLSKNNREVEINQIEVEENGKKKIKMVKECTQPVELLEEMFKDIPSSVSKPKTENKFSEEELKKLNPCLRSIFGSM